jgi:hypothetical protein
MFRKIFVAATLNILALICAPNAEATCSSYPYTLTNGTTADATQVMANLNCAALTSGATLANVSQLGIGMSPTYVLDVEAGSANDSTLARFDSTTSGSSGAGIRITNSGTTNAWFGYGAFGVTGLGLTDIGLAARGALAFDTNSGHTTPAMYISTAANVGIGTVSPSYTLHVNGSVAGTSAYNNLSDVRLKRDITPLVGGLALISQLQPVRFDWRSEDEREVGKEFNLPSGKQIGFIAQDLGKVLPEAVSTAKGKDAIMSVAESKVVPVLVAAVKELKAANDNQAAEIDRLESRVVVLERKVQMQTAAN